MAPVGLSIVPLDETVVKQMLFSMMHLHHRHRDARAVRGADQDRVDQVRRAAVEHILQGELAHRRQVERLLDAPHALEDPQGKLRVLDAVPDDLVLVPLPFLIDLPAFELVLPFPEELLRDVVERLLLQVQGQALRLHRPPDVREDPSVDAPKALAHVEEVREVAGEL